MQSKPTARHLAILAFAMALATVTVTPTTTRLQGGADQAYAAVAEGELAVLSAGLFNWINLTGCAVQANGGLKDTIATEDHGYGQAGGVSNVTIDSGDGWFEFVAPVPFADPVTGYTEFTGRAFFGGLTSQSEDVVAPADIEFGLEVGPGGVTVYEQGVAKGTFRASRNNGRYYVGIESGQVVYRADDQVIYRSDQPVTYPVRAGACFYHRSTDAIGGTPSSDFTYTAYDEAGAVAGSWVDNVWTSPDARGLYRIVVNGEDYLFGSATAEIARTFPYDGNTNGLPPPAIFRQIRSETDYKVTELPLDDQAAFYNVPLPDAEPVRTWRVEWNNLRPEYAAIMDAFFEEHKGRGHWFYLYDQYAEGGAGATWDNVRVKRYETGVKKDWNQPRKWVLERRPV